MCIRFSLIFDLFWWNFDKIIDFGVDIHICHLSPPLLTKPNVLRMGCSTTISSNGSTATIEPIEGNRNSGKYYSFWRFSQKWVLGKWDLILSPLIIQTFGFHQQKKKIQANTWIFIQFNKVLWKKSLKFFTYEDRISVSKKISHTVNITEEAEIEWTWPQTFE